MTTLIVRRFPVFPTEILEQICLRLPLDEAFRLAIGLRLLRIRNRLLPSYYAKFNSDLRLDEASKAGDVELLQAWLDSGVKLTYYNHGARYRYTTSAIVCASLNGHVDVLSWWKSSGLEFNYTREAFQFGIGSETGLHDDYTTNETLMINSLNWWRDSGFPMLNEDAMDTASIRGLTRVLSWWKDESGQKPVYSRSAFHTHWIASLEWWKKSGLPMLEHPRVLHHVLTKWGNHPALRMRTINWWRDNTAISFTAEDGDDASSYGNVDILQWLKEAGELRYTENAMDFAGSPETLQWWVENVDPGDLKYTEWAVWKTSGLAPKWTDETFAEQMELAHEAWNWTDDEIFSSDDDGTTGSDDDESDESGTDVGDEADNDKVDSVEDDIED
ncbi:hypothetical protein HDU87_007216 [Geranomyces variabilis]|uniref:Uncharacterized protein n=1 Tax=Geranomyces variabilis TaxID=109894 RepID=A0AAD5XMW0_9FUNG|nr:hypothetical protein HDU87_007216 [Geranomyces variabilis]